MNIKGNDLLEFEINFNETIGANEIKHFKESILEIRKDNQEIICSMSEKVKRFDEDTLDIQNLSEKLTFEKEVYPLEIKKNFFEITKIDKKRKQQISKDTQTIESDLDDNGEMIDANEVIPRLQKHVTSIPWLSTLIEKLQESINTDCQLFNQFYSNYSVYYQTYYTCTIEDGHSKIIKLNEMLKEISSIINKSNSAFNKSKLAKKLLNEVVIQYQKNIN